MYDHQVFDFLITMVIYQNQKLIFWDDHGYQPRLIPGRGLVQFLISAPLCWRTCDKSKLFQHEAGQF